MNILYNEEIFFLMFEKKIFGKIKIKINFYKRRELRENDKKKNLIN